MLDGNCQEMRLILTTHTLSTKSNKPTSQGVILLYLVTITFTSDGEMLEKFETMNKKTYQIKISFHIFHTDDALINYCISLKTYILSGLHDMKIVKH